MAKIFSFQMVVVFTALTIFACRPQNVTLVTSTPTKSLSPTQVATEPIVSNTVIPPSPSVTDVFGTPTFTSSAIVTNTPSTTPTPTITPTPLPFIGDILTPEKAIDYSYYWQGQNGQFIAPSKEITGFINVIFPDGDEGSFVTLSSGGGGGSTFLYRVQKEKAELIDHTESGVRWGVSSMQNVNDPHPERVAVTPLQLFENEKGSIIKITGTASAGTGLLSEGIFEIIQITDSGGKIIFSGTEGDYLFRYPTEQGGEAELNQYEYVDLDSDGKKEIVEESKACQYKFDENKNEWEQTTCGEPFSKVYKFNGEEYIKVD